MKRSALIILALLVCLIPPAAAQEEFPFSGKITAGDVNVRAGQSKNFEELGRLEQDETVIVVGKSFSWYKILLPDHSKSYVFAKFVEPLGDGIGMVTATNLNIRARGDVQSSVIGRLNKGAMVRIVERSDDWVRIAPVDQSFGWVLEDFVKFSSLSVPPPRVVTPPVRNVYKRKRMQEQQQAAVARPAEPKTPAAPTPAPVRSKSVAATGVITALGGQSVTQDIRHQLVVDGKPVYCLKGYRKVMDGFLNYKASIEGELLPDIRAPHPVVLVTKIRLIL